MRSKQILTCNLSLYALEAVVLIGCVLTWSLWPLVALTGFIPLAWTLDRERLRA